MKIKKAWFLLLLIISPIFVSAKTISGEYGDYEKAIDIVKETMTAYYIRGPYFQYNYAKATYGIDAPEEATSQDTKYAVCAAFTYNVYTEAFGMYYNASDKRKFPRYNYNIIDEAYSEYHSGNDLDGNFLIYYESTVNTKSSTGQKNNRNVERYVYGDTNISSDNNDFETIVNNVKPGDLFVYTGHALIAYDVVINPNTNKKDVLILNSNLSPYISSRIDSTSKLSYNIFKSKFGNNNYLDIDNEGTFQFLWLSNISSFVKNGKLKCQKEECAIIRPFYEKNGKAVFNYDITLEKYNTGSFRTKYPGLMIEKTVNTGDNDSVYVGDSLKYTIKITNKSTALNVHFAYEDFKIEETLSNNVEYVSASHGGVLNGNKIIWTFNQLTAGSNIELTYTVKVKDSVSVVGKEISSVGKFYSPQNSGVYVTTGTVKNMIIPKVASLTDSYKNCYNEKKGTYKRLELIDQIYKCATNIDFNFDNFNFNNLFIKVSNGKVNSKINFKENLDADHNRFKKMILNNYFNGLTSDNGKYYLPRWSSNSTSYRAKTINSSDFKDGDVLIYNIDSSKYTKENGIYAYIYIDGEFVGVNGSDSTLRNKFTYKYYNDNGLGLNDNLYAASSKLSSNKESILKFVNYQSLYDKDNYVILRPEILMKELVNLDVISPSKTSYIQNYENIDLTGGKVKIIYNDGSVDTINMDNELVRVSGFDNSKVGKNVIVLEYSGYTTTFDVDIVLKDVTKIEIETKPIKSYYIQNYENIDLTGGKLKIIYNDDSVDTIDMDNELVMISGFDNSKLGKNTITLKYGEQEITFEVEIISKQVKNIEIKEKPIKLSYIQNSEQIDLTGGVIKVIYNDGIEDTISMDNELVKVSGFDNSKLGKNTITVEYEGYSTTFEIKIISENKVELPKMNNSIIIIIIFVVLSILGYILLKKRNV